MVHEEGFSYLDIPILYNEDASNISTICRFVYLHGKKKLSNINGSASVKEISKSDIYNNVINSMDMCSIALDEKELLCNITRVLENDIVFNKIISFYHLALEIFNKK